MGTKLLLLLLLTTVNPTTSSTTATGERRSDGEVDVLLRLAIRARLESYGKEVYAALLPHLQPPAPSPSSSGGRRSKRAIITADNPLLPRSRRKIHHSPSPSSTTKQDDGGAWIVKEIWRPSPTFLDSLPLQPTTPPPYAILPFSLHNISFIAALVATPATPTTTLILYRLAGVESAVEVTRLNLTGPPPTSLQLLDIDGAPHLLPLIPADGVLTPLPSKTTPTSNNSGESVTPPASGSPLLRLDLVRRRLLRVQTLSTPWSTPITGGGGVSASWRGTDGVVWLGLAPLSSLKLGSRGGVGLYRWQGGYLDQVSSLPASHPTSLTHFSLLNNQYLAIANYMDPSGSTSIHSELYKWGHREGDWVSFQRIRTFGAKHMVHFSFKGGTEEGGGRTEHFLAIANNCVRDEDGKGDERVKSVIMKWGSHRFIPFKSFHTRGAQQFLPLSWGDKFVLVLLEVDRLRLFQYNGWSFSQVKHFDLVSGGGGGGGALTLQPFPFQPHFFLLSAKEANMNSTPTQPSSGGLYAVSFSHRNDHSQLGAGLESWCTGARRRLESIDLTQLGAAISSAPKSHDPILRLGSGSLEWKGPLHVNSIVTAELNVKGRGLNGELASNLDSLQRQVGEGGVVRELGKRLASSLHRHQPHVTSIPSSTSIIFSSLVFSPHAHPGGGGVNPLSGLATREAELGSWNGVGVEGVVGGLLLSNQPNSLNALSSLTVTPFNMGVELEGGLNGAPLSDYATKSSSSGGTFLRPVTFKSSSVELGGRSLVNGTLAGLELRSGAAASSKYLLARGNQSLEGVVRVGGGRVPTQATSLFTRWLNGKNIETLFQDGVPLHGDVTITASHTWLNISTSQLHLLHPTDRNGTSSGSGSRGRSGLGLGAILQSAILTTSPGEKSLNRLSGGARFRHLVVGGDGVGLGRGHGHGLVNGKINLGVDFVSVSNGGNYSFGELVLTQGGSIGQLNISSKLGRLDVGEAGDFGLLLKDSPHLQQLRNKGLKGLHFGGGGDISATASFGGLKLGEWSPSQRIRLNSHTLSRRATIHGSILATHTRINKSLRHSSHSPSSGDLLHLLSHGALRSSSSTKFCSSPNFSSLHVGGDSGGVATLNGVSPTDWLPTPTTANNNKAKGPVTVVKGRKFVLGSLRLTETTTQASSLRAVFTPPSKGGSSSEGDVLSILPNLLLLNQDQTISAPTIFTSTFQADRVDCEGVRLGGVQFSSLLLRRGEVEQGVEVVTLFDSLVAVRQGLTLNSSLTLLSLQGGRNLTEDMEDTLRISHPHHQQHKGPGPHPPQKEQVISGELAFEAPLTIGTLLTPPPPPKTTDRVVVERDIDSLLSSLVRGDRSSPLELSSTSLHLSSGFSSTSSSGGVDIGDGTTLNGIPSSVWGRSWLLSTSNQTVTTPTRFLASLYLGEEEEDSYSTSGGIWVSSGMVGGVNVPALASNTLRTDRAARFSHGRVAGGGGVVVGLLALPTNATLNNGLHPDSQLVTRNKGSRISGVKIFEGGVRVVGPEGGVDTHTLDGSDVSAALGFLYAPPTTGRNTSRGRPHSHSHSKGRLLVKGSLQLNKEPAPPTSLNGLSWSTLLRSVWFTSTPVTLTHPPTFGGRVEFKGGASTTNTRKDGGVRLSGVSLSSLQQNTASRTKDQVWTGNVILQGAPNFQDSLEAEELRISGGGSWELNGLPLPSFLLLSLLSNGTNQTMGGSGWTSLSANHLRLTGGKKGVVTVNGVEVDPSSSSPSWLSLHGPNSLLHPSTNKERVLLLLEGLEVDNLLLLPLSTPPTLNGLNLTEWKETGLVEGAHNSSFTLATPLRLPPLARVRSLRVPSGVVDGVRLVDLLLRTGPQDIGGGVRIDGGDVIAPGGVTLHGPLNGVLLSQTLGTLAIPAQVGGRDIVINGRLTFERPLGASRVVTGRGLVGGRNLTALLSTYHRGDVIPQDLHFRAKDNYAALSAYTDNAIQFAQRRATWIQYWGLSQVVEVASSSSKEVGGVGGILNGFLLFSTPSPSLLLLWGGSRGRGGVDVVDGSWWTYSGTEDAYLPPTSGEGGGLRVSGGQVKDILELGGGRWALAVTSTSSSRPVTISLPLSSAHKDIFRTKSPNLPHVVTPSSNGGSGRHSRVYILAPGTGEEEEDEDDDEEEEEGYQFGTIGGWSVETTVHGVDFGGLEWVGGCLVITAPSEGVAHLLCSPTPISNRSQEPLHLRPTRSIPLPNPALIGSLELESGRAILLLHTLDDPESGAGGGVEEGVGVVQVWEQLLPPTTPPPLLLPQGGGVEKLDKRRRRIGRGVVGSGEWVKRSCIPVLNGVSMGTEVGANSSPWLAIASSPSPSTTTNYQGAVFLYRYSESLGEFEKTQSLEVVWPLEVKFLVVGGSGELLLFILTAAPNNNLLLFKFHGVSGWNLEHGWSSPPGARGLEVGDYFVGGVGRSHVFLWGGNETRIYSAIYKGTPTDVSEEEEQRHGIQEE